MMLEVKLPEEGEAPPTIHTMNYSDLSSDESQEEVVVGLVTQSTTKEARLRLEDLRVKIQHYIIETFTVDVGFIITEKNVCVFERALFDVLVAKYNYEQGNEMCASWQGKCFDYFYQLLASVCPDHASEDDATYHAAGSKLLRMSDNALYACYDFVEPVFDRASTASPKTKVKDICIADECERFYDQ